MPEAPISYQQAENLSARLADKLRRHLGADLPASRFVACPRGGFIVLGMLSYCLGLEKSQLEDPAGGEGPVVVVDDCAISGAQSGAMIERLGSKRIVFAHLFSHPRLRQNLVDREPNVEACIAAKDLRAYRDFEPDERAAWAERLPGRRYWLGVAEQLAFAWSEPRVVMWNARTGRLEDRWHWSSPRACLATRSVLDPPFPEGEIEGVYDLPSGVLWKRDGEAIVLWNPQTDHVYGLEDIACAMWRSLMSGGDLEASAVRLGARYEVEEGQLRRDLRTFVDELSNLGLLVEVGPEKALVSPTETWQ